jgi:hypothetical protein
MLIFMRLPCVIAVEKPGFMFSAISHFDNGPEHFFEWRMIEMAAGLAQAC